MAAAITAAVIAVGATAYAASESAKSQKKANATNQKLTKETNRANLLMNLVSRGAPMEGPNFPDSVQGQSSSILPIYLGKTEENLGKNAQDILAAIQKYYGTPEEQLARNEQVAGRFGEAGAASDRLVQDLATGKVTDEMLAEAKPVMEARTKLAESKRNAGLEALSEILNENEAIQSGKGFSGDSTGNRIFKFNARRAVGSQAAADFGAANIANAEEVRGIKGAGRNLRLSNINLPDTMAAASIRRGSIPVEGVNFNQQQQLQPFKFFNIGPGAPTQFQPYQPVQPVASTGQIIGQSVGAGAGAYGNYLSNQQLISALNRNPNIPPGPSTGDWANEAKY